MHALCEIQKVLYQQESHRTNENILHIYIHATYAYAYGKYYHVIISHATDQYKIINGRSSNTESDERYFHTIIDISDNISNHHPDNTISNAFIRWQMRKDFHEDGTILRTEASLTKIYTKMSMYFNSFIRFEVLKKSIHGSIKPS